MSADRAVLTEVDLEAGVASVKREISLEELFGEDGRWVILEDEHGWAGYECEDLDGDWRFWWVDTRRPGDAWTRRLTCGPKAVLEAARQRMVHVDPFETVEEVGS